MAAKESVWVSPSEKRVRAQILYEGRKASTKVMANENNVAISKMADSSRPEALMTGVCRWRQKTNATNNDNKIPSKSRRNIHSICHFEWISLNFICGVYV